MGTPLVSVVIPTFRRRNLVARALASLATQTLTPSAYEVVVAIDGSEDGTRELVEQFVSACAVRALWQPNQGRAAACNAGADAARGDLLVLLDDDMEAPPQFLEAHLRAHAGNTRLGVLGPVPVVNRASRVAAYIAAKFDRHLSALGDPERRMSLRDFYSGNFSIRRDTFWSAGGFDRGFKIYGNEDLELAVRLTRAGVCLRYAPEALAHQQYTKNFSELARDATAKGRTAVLLAQKHPDVLHQLRLSTDEYGTPGWKAVRNLLVGASVAWSGLPRVVTRLVDDITELSPRRLDLCYTLMLDYYYWLGATLARREVRSHGSSALADLSVTSSMQGTP